MKYFILEKSIVLIISSMQAGTGKWELCYRTAGVCKLTKNEFIQIKYMHLPFSQEFYF